MDGQSKSPTLLHCYRQVIHKTDKIIVGVDGDGVRRICSLQPVRPCRRLKGEYDGLGVFGTLVVVDIKNQRNPSFGNARARYRKGIERR